MADEPINPAQPTEPAAPTPTVETPPATGDPTDWKAEAEKWKALSRKHEENAKSNRAGAEQGTKAQQQLAAILKAAGINPDGSKAADPEALAAQLTQRAEAAELAAWRSGVTLSVHQAAATAGADPKQLLHWTPFLDTLDELIDDDPTTEEFRSAIESKVREFLAENPSFASGKGASTGPRPDPSQGARGNQPTRPSSLGQALAAHYAAKKT